MSSEETTPISKPTRAAFIRALPIEMPVEEVIERAREVGLVLQPSDIHAARYYMRQAAAAEARDKLDVTLPSLRRFTVTTRVRPELRESVPPRTEPPVQNRTPNRTPARTPNRTPNRTLDVAQPMSKERTARIVSEALRSVPKSTHREQKSSNSPEAQLREIVLRLGTDRTRKVLDDLDKLALRIARPER